MQNQKQLAENTTKYHGAAKGAARRGPALLAGLLRCARCGRKLHVCYTGKARVVRYHCRGGNINHGVASCQSFGGLRPEQAIETLVLDTLQPLGVKAALQAWESSRQEQDLKTKSLALALEKARYEAERIRRQFDAVDPANRLVSAELESRWNTRLVDVEQAERNLDAARSTLQPLSEAERQRLLQLGSDLQSVWCHPATPVTLKKRILRTVIEEIVADVDDSAKKITFKIHWVGGVHTALRIPKNYTGGHRRVAEGEVVDLVRELVRVCSDAAIASILNRLGYHTGVGNTWTETRVVTLRRERDITGHQKFRDDSWVTLSGAAKELKVCPGVVRKLVTRKILPATQVVQNAPWIIKRENLRLEEVQQYIAAVHAGKNVPRHDNGQIKLSL